MISENAKVMIDLMDENITISDFAIVYSNVELNVNVNIGEHAVIGRQAPSSKAIVRNIAKDGIVRIGDNSVVSSNVVIYSKVVIGKDSLIGDNSSILSDVEIGNGVLISRNVTINSNVKIGNNTRIMDNSHITGRTTIGDNVFISVGVSMANDNSFGKFGFGDNVNGPIIEDFVSIGVGAILLPNVRLGKGSIISAGSVVREDVPPNVIVAGNPAAIVTRVPKSMRRY